MRKNLATPKYNRLAIFEAFQDRQAMTEHGAMRRRGQASPITDEWEQGTRARWFPNELLSEVLGRGRRVGCDPHKEIFFAQAISLRI